MCEEKLLCVEVFEIFSIEGQKRGASSPVGWDRDRAASKVPGQLTLSWWVQIIHPHRAQTQTHTQRYLNPPSHPPLSFSIASATNQGPVWVSHSHAIYNALPLPAWLSVWLRARKHRSPLASQAHNKSSSWQHNSPGDLGPEPWAVQHGDLALARCLPAPFSYGPLTVP